MPVQPSDEIVALFTEEESMEGVECSYGSFPVDEYMNALTRAEGELCYSHSLGMRYTKVTEHMYMLGLAYKQRLMCIPCQIIPTDTSGAGHLNVTITRSKFEMLVNHLIERTRIP